MTHLGGSIDEFKVDLFQGTSRDLGHQGLSQHEDFLLGSNHTSLHHKEVISDHTIVGETSQRSDIFISQISISGGIVLHSSIGTFSYSVDLLVDFSSVMVTQLTGSRHRESDSSGMPRSDTTNFSVTSVGFLL